jgi:hypothetical protein
LVDYWWNSWTLIAYGAILEEVADWIRWRVKVAKLNEDNKKPLWRLVGIHGF